MKEQFDNVALASGVVAIWDVTALMLSLKEELWLCRVSDKMFPKEIFWDFSGDLTN
jgi:hypothetical protein